MATCRTFTKPTSIAIWMAMVAFTLGTAYAQIQDVGPHLNNYQPDFSVCNPDVLFGGHSVSGRVLSLAASANGQRLYAGTFAGVWRSDDAGGSWGQMTLPQPPNNTHGVVLVGSLEAPIVVDLAVSPYDADRVFAATLGDVHNHSLNGLYRSVDGGANWSRVFPTAGSTSFACDRGTLGADASVGQVTLAPGNPSLVFATGGCGLAVSQDGGTNWSETPVPRAGSLWHIAVGRAETVRRSGVFKPIRRVYGVGNNQFWYSEDGGRTFVRDPAGPTTPGIGVKTDTVGSSARILAVDPSAPSRIYLAVPSGANGPSFFPSSGLPWTDGTPCQALLRVACGEGSIWMGDYSGLPSGGSVQWRQLSGPPVYWGNTASGAVYVEAKSVPGGGSLVFFSDANGVHVSSGEPTSSASWHRLEGLDASETKRLNDLNPVNRLSNQSFVHADPHSLAFSPDFDITLGPAAGVLAPYNQNSILTAYRSGKIWMGNDGGVFGSVNGGPCWTLGSGLYNLIALNVALSSQGTAAPALYMGTGDTDDFFSPAGGALWGDPDLFCADCDWWFNDPADPTRVLQIAPRNGVRDLRSDVPGFNLYFGVPFPDPRPPGAGNTSTRFVIPNPPSICSAGSTPPCPPGEDLLSGSNAISFSTYVGYRPLIMTLASEAVPADLDLVLIQKRPDLTRVLLRSTHPSSITIPGDWNPGSLKARQIGPVLPANDINVVQVAGGHASPTYYVSNPDKNSNAYLWKLDTVDVTRNTVNRIGPTTGPVSRSSTPPIPPLLYWRQIVPGPRVTKAIRFFVDPYNPNLIYVVNPDAIRRSTDGGLTWEKDSELDAIATDGGRYSYNGDSSVIKDMVFEPTEPGTIFAVGTAGVFARVDGWGWRRLVSTSAMPGNPAAAAFSRPTRMLYVAWTGRSLTRVGPVPLPRPLVLPVHHR
jgi:hypothetical protein